jgi:hypothetical protein
MDPKKLFVDERLTGFCVYCGEPPETSDHAPSKILLDSPLPSDLAVVDCCQPCNSSFSDDERYLACLLECVIEGTTDPQKLRREKVARTLKSRPHIAAEIAAGREEDIFGGITWKPDHARIRKSILKLARAHIAYELSLPQFGEPKACSFQPLVSLMQDERDEFENPDAEIVVPWPEIGSRAFQRAVVGWPGTEVLQNGWLSVQDGRYRYRVDQVGGCSARMVLSEYLACFVAWE